MNLIPYRKRRNISSLSPFSFIEDLQADLDSFFGNSLISYSPSNQGTLTSNWLPSTDIHDLGNQLLVKTDLPGIDKKDLDVSVEGNTLFIRGEKKHEEATKDFGHIRSERFFGSFERALPLTEDIDASKIDASYKDGVLTVTVPRKEEAKQKQIKVNIK